MRGQERSEENNEKGIIEGRTCGLGDQDNSHFQMPGFLFVRPHHTTRSLAHLKIRSSFLLSTFLFPFLFFNRSHVFDDLDQRLRIVRPFLYYVFFVWFTISSTYTYRLYSMYGREYSCHDDMTDGMDYTGE